VAKAFLKKWYFWGTHSRLPPIIKAARTIKRHEAGILRWFHSCIANGILEGINSLVQAAKTKARSTDISRPSSTSSPASSICAYPLETARNRQCNTSFIADAAALRLVDIIGEDNIMWGADYPRAEGTWGYTNEMLKGMWDQLGPVAGAKFLSGNAARLWNL